MPNQPTKPMPVTLLEWKPLRRNTLRGFAKIQLGALKLHELTVHISNGRKWVGLPSRPLIIDGQPAKDGRGKQKYSVLLEWDNRDTADRFSTAVIEAIEARHPGETDEGE